MILLRRGGRKSGRDGKMNRRMPMAWTPGIVAVLICGCATLPEAPVASSEKVLRVGVTPNYPPVIFRERDEIIGLEADFARMLASDLGKTLRFVNLPWTGQVAALGDGRTDIIMSGMSMTPERSAVVIFCEPYLEVGQLIMFRGRDLYTFQYPRVIYLIETRIGVEKGTTGDMLVQQRCRRAKRVEFSSAEKAVDALIRKKVDVVVHDAPALWRLAALHEGEGIVVNSAPLTQEYLAWAVALGSEELLRDANDALRRWKEDGRFLETVGRWLPLE